MSRQNFLHQWEGFLPTQTVVMGKRSPGEAAAPDLAKNDAQPDSAQDPRPLLSFVVPTQLSADQADTFGKMTSALGLASQDFELIVADTSPARGYGVIFLNAAQSTWINESTLSTYNLQLLLDQPAAKKAIWNDLKILLARVRNEQ